LSLWVMLKVWWVWCVREIVMEECVEGWMEGRSKKVYYMSESLSIVIIGAIVVLYCCDLASYCAVLVGTKREESWRGWA
jgi:hypothetical protein